MVAVAFATVLALHQITMLLKTEEEENFEKEVVLTKDEGLFENTVRYSSRKCRYRIS